MTQLSFQVLPAEIPSLPKGESPSNRLREAGPQACAAAELLAILIGGRESLATAYLVLAKCDTLTDLTRLSGLELAAIPGLGPITSGRIQAAIELGRRLTAILPVERAAITSPADAASLLMPEMSGFEEEHMRVILLDTRNRVLAIVEVYKGSLNTAMIRIGEVFKDAVRRNAASIIVAHNHPSGDPSPSPEDVAVTRLLVEAGRLLDIAVHDHLVIGGGRFVSLKERGLGFS